MVGFGEKITSQVIPEWRKKYIRYVYLASILDKLPIIPENFISESHDADDDGELRNNCNGTADRIRNFESIEMEKIRFHGRKMSDKLCSANPKSSVSDQFLICSPFKTKILVSLKHGDDIILNIDCWRFDLGPSCSLAGSGEVDFFKELNEDISIFVDFQARILCQCIEEFDMLLLYKSHILDQGAEQSKQSASNQSIFGMASAALEKEKLLSAYEQLYKLCKYLECYMEGNIQALRKILKKHSKHSFCRNGQELFVAIEKGMLAFPDDSAPAAAPAPAHAVPLVLDLTFLQQELIEPIENQYVALRLSADRSASRHAAHTVLRGKAGLDRHGHSHLDTFLLGLLLGVAVPLVLYSASVVIGDRDIHNSPLWPVG